MKVLKIKDKISDSELEFGISEHTLNSVFRESTIKAFVRATITSIVTAEYLYCGACHYERLGSAEHLVFPEEEDHKSLLREIDYRLNKAQFQII